MTTCMKKTRSLLGAMVTLAVCAAGCGGYGDKWSGPVGLDDLCEVVVNDICDDWECPRCDSRFDTGTCRGPASDGEPCLSDYNCEEPLACLPTYSDPRDPGTCGPRVGAGELCDSLDDCAEGFECSDGLCGPLPGLGETCNYDQCSGNLVCEQDVCVHARYPGDNCGEEDSACILSNCVDGKCQARAALGKPCVEDYDCASRTCMEGECVDDTGCLP